MKPTLAAEELKRNLTQYLTTTFAVTDRPVRDGLERFLKSSGDQYFTGALSPDPDAVQDGDQ